jgi:hypothetical protein
MWWQLAAATSGGVDFVGPPAIQNWTHTNVSGVNTHVQHGEPATATAV